MQNSIPAWLKGIHGQNYSDLINCRDNPSIRENRIAIKLFDEILPSSDFSDFRFIVMNEWRVDPSRPSLGKGDLVLTNGKNLLVIEIKSICSRDPKIRLKGLLKVIRQARYYALVVKRYRDFCLFKDYRMNIFFRQAKVHSAFFTNLDSDIVLLNRVCEKNLFIKDKDLHMKGITVEEIYRNNILDRQSIIDEENNEIEGKEATEKEGFIENEEENESKKNARMKEGLESLFEIVISSDEEDINNEENDEDIVFYNEVAVHKPSLILMEKPHEREQSQQPQKRLSSENQFNTAVKANIQVNRLPDYPGFNLEVPQKLIQDKINKVKENKSHMSQLLRPLDQDETWNTLDRDNKTNNDNLSQKENQNGAYMNEQHQKDLKQQNTEFPSKITDLLLKQKNKVSNQVDNSGKKQQMSQDNLRNLQLLLQKIEPQHNLTSSSNHNKKYPDIIEIPEKNQQLNRNRNSISEFQAKLQHLVEVRIANKQLQDRKKEQKMNCGEQNVSNKQNTVIQIQDDDEEEEECKSLSNDETEDELKKFIESRLALKQSDDINTDKLKMSANQKKIQFEKMRLLHRKMKLRNGNTLTQIKACNSSNFINLENDDEEEEEKKEEEEEEEETKKSGHLQGVKKVAFSLEESIGVKSKGRKQLMKSWKKNTTTKILKKKKNKNRNNKRESKKQKDFQEKQRKKKFAVQSSTESSLDKDTEEEEFEFISRKINRECVNKTVKKKEKNTNYKKNNKKNSQSSKVIKVIKLKILNPKENAGTERQEQKEHQAISQKTIKLTIQKNKEDHSFQNKEASQNNLLKQLLPATKLKDNKQLKIIKIQKKRAEETNEIREQEFIPLPVKKIKIAIKCAKTET